jgi:hypothetical protein
VFAAPWIGVVCVWPVAPYGPCGTGELEVALSRLRSVHASYWDYDWRRANRGGGRYPEHELWEAVQGYLDLLDADKEV